MSKGTVTSEGQITIPAEVRDALKLKVGDEVDFFPTVHGDYLIQRSTGSIMDMRGILKRMGYVPEGRTVTIEEMDQAIGDHVVELDRRTISDYVEDGSEEIIT
jgi:AbrB family looped-hinge helix DNA binding protein